MEFTFPSLDRLARGRSWMGKPGSMRSALAAGVAAVVVLLAATAAAAAPALILERARPVEGVHLGHLKELDRLHLSRKKIGAFSSALHGMSWLYYTRVKLGNPAKEYYLQFDTGSDIMWVSCSPCNGCPQSSELNFPLELYNPSSSSTSSKISCFDERCRTALKTGYAVCNASHWPNNICGYSLAYADGSAMLGYYVSDTIYFNGVMENDRSTDPSASVFFGCSNSRSGEMNMDGIIGFGKGTLSIISQLSSQGVFPKVFSHCLQRSKEGGGILVFDEITQQGYVSTPLVPTQSQYNLNMKSIAVNGQKLPINSSLFATSTEQGTIVDSGTRLSYLADGFYDPVINAIYAAISPSVRYFLDMGVRYFISSNSTRALSLFPTVTLYFEDGAAMKVGPESYLLRKGPYDNDNLFIVGFQRSKDNEGYKRITILGDLVLRDKIFVYNLEKMRMGWVDYDCSLLNVTTHFVVSGSMGHRAPSYYDSWISIGVGVVITITMQHIYSY